MNECAESDRLSLLALCQLGRQRTYRLGVDFDHVPAELHELGGWSWQAVAFFALYTGLS